MWELIMLDLQEFKNKNFIDQISILNNIGKKDADAATIKALVDLYLNPLGDQPVDAMVRHILSDLLSVNETETVKLLKSPNPDVRKLSMQITGRKNYQTAAPVLIKLLTKEKSPGNIYEVFLTMSKLKSPEFLPVFKENFTHGDELVAALCIGMIAEYNDESEVPRLNAMVEEAGSEENYETCTLATATAIETLGRICGPGVLDFFVKMLHHKNPTARRLIHEELVKCGEKAVPFIAKVFDTDRTDDRILAANLLGLIGSKKGGDVLIEALDKEKTREPNVKFAIYEAFGNIHFMKGLVCLMDAVTEEDPLILICVMTSLDKQVNSFVTDKIKETVGDKPGEGHGKRILQAINAARAVNIFNALYSDEKLAEHLIEEIACSNDPDVVKTFLEAVKNQDQPYSDLHAKALNTRLDEIGALGIKVLAVDDSRSMLAFYRKVLSDIGTSIVTAENGKEALVYVQLEDVFHFGYKLIVTDMNMPEMDGIEFTRKFRENQNLKEIPIIMVTTESENSQRQLALNAGVNDFITKPATTDIFLEKIRKYLPK